jgi:hypothetical protein
MASKMSLMVRDRRFMDKYVKLTNIRTASASLGIIVSMSFPV